MKTLILLTCLLNGCGLTSGDITPNHIKAAEKLCEANGGIKVITPPYSLLLEQLIVTCQNTAYFNFRSYKPFVENKDANVQN